MKKITVLFLILISGLTIFSYGTQLNVLGIYTLNFDDKDNFADVFPIMYFESELYPNLKLKMDYYLDFKIKDSIKLNEEYDFPAPQHYSLEYQTNKLYLTLGTPKFKSYSYDLIKNYGYRIGGIKDDLDTGIAGTYKLNDILLGGYYNLNYNPFSKTDHDDSYALLAGYDSRYNKTMFYFHKNKFDPSSKKSITSLSMDGYHSIKFNSKNVLQIFYGLGYGVNSIKNNNSSESILDIPTGLLNDVSDIAKLITKPKFALGFRHYLKPFYYKGLFYGDLSKEENVYPVHVDGAFYDPRGKYWAYDFRTGYQIDREWAIESFIQGNSHDEGILTDYITNYGISLYNRDFNITFAMTDANGRVSGKQNIVINFTTWTSFVFKGEAFIY
ncbi:hypothetical protein OF820_08150 [Oceanotoga sp. DSM 15011]|jgi:hypothetical protein|uniref:hypothetical protein n=1 Tax=Oceanotoga sp. DSM 15011 TaxID=2984951 RepID=UPI0021F438EC|nr:hypothetical protein [Oceanotoga sp. DSM 15011]UYO99046.1 hypothetical protein OF820_08150 [Oceanotoga sp. DSM 15011]